VSLFFVVTLLGCTKSYPEQTIQVEKIIWNSYDGYMFFARANSNATEVLHWNIHDGWDENHQFLHGQVNIIEDVPAGQKNFIVVVAHQHADADLWASKLEIHVHSIKEDIAIAPSTTEQRTRDQDANYMYGG
jgi:hypothetical protein